MLLTLIDSDILYNKNQYLYIKLKCVKTAYVEYRIKKKKKEKSNKIKILKIVLYSIQCVKQ